MKDQKNDKDQTDQTDPWAWVPRQQSVRSMSAKALARAARRSI